MREKLLGQLNEQEMQFSFHSLTELIEWTDSVRQRTNVKIETIALNECVPWYYDNLDGSIHNNKKSFFEIIGIQSIDNEGMIVAEQPIILQEEIGFLGIICCKINGVWHYLMQAKIEPGNVNSVQISPTIQATKSNFEKKHGGNEPLFLDFFLKMKPEQIIVDQIQSEQSSRFLKKRNRNVIIKVDQFLEETKNHRWMTLRQIKQLMKIENLVNMDTRTVLSCIPYVWLGELGDIPFVDKYYFQKSSEYINRDAVISLFNFINDEKMFKKIRRKQIPLKNLVGWKFNENGIFSESAPFDVIYCDISIEGREVQNWRQPLFSSKGKALLGLFCRDNEGILEFLVKPRREIGCFDMLEIGPTVQAEYNHPLEDWVEKFFYKRMQEGNGVIADIVQSEEGGRFYHEQNRNVLIMVSKEDIEDCPTGYVWTSFGTLNLLTQINNCVNIQLRNLLSILEI